MTKNEKLDELNLPENCAPKPRSSFDYELVECLSEHPLCNFVLHFGYGFLCRHPQRKEIIEKLNAMKNSENQQD